jgi:nucleotide-binding universal stress UspA family protein
VFKNVLAGVDGRPNGRDAIALASRLTDPDGRLTLANVDSAGLRPTGAVSPVLVREEREASAKMLEGERAAVGASAAELITLVALSPGAALHRQAEEQGADLLVVGSCSHGTVGRVMLGDDTRTALNGAPCAVAIASVGYAGNAAPIRRVGVAYNGSPESGAALAVARELAAQNNASVHALDVVSIPTYAFTGMGIAPPAIGYDIDEMLKEANGRVKELSGVEGHAVYGLAGEELAAFGDELDILIVGSRSYGPVRRLVLGSTSDYLERHARCSLLVLPRGGSATMSAS